MNETELTDDWDERKSAASSRPLVLDPRLKSYMGMSLIKLSQAVEQAFAGDNLRIIQLDGIGKEYVCHCYKNLLGSDQRVCFDFFEVESRLSTKSQSIKCDESTR